MRKEKQAFWHRAGRPTQIQPAAKLTGNHVSLRVWQQLWNARWPHFEGEQLSGQDNVVLWQALPGFTPWIKITGYTQLLNCPWHLTTPNPKLIPSFFYSGLRQGNQPKTDPCFPGPQQRAAPSQASARTPASPMWVPHCMDSVIPTLSVYRFMPGCLWLIRHSQYHYSKKKKK